MHLSLQSIMAVTSHFTCIMLPGFLHKALRGVVADAMRRAERYIRTGDRDNGIIRPANYQRQAATTNMVRLCHLPGNDSVPLVERAQSIDVSVYFVFRHCFEKSRQLTFILPVDNIGL